MHQIDLVEPSRFSGLLPFLFPFLRTNTPHSGFDRVKNMGPRTSLASASFDFAASPYL